MIAMEAPLHLIDPPAYVVEIKKRRRSRSTRNRQRTTRSGPIYNVLPPASLAVFVGMVLILDNDERCVVVAQYTDGTVDCQVQ